MDGFLLDGKRTAKCCNGAALQTKRPADHRKRGRSIVNGGKTGEEHLLAGERRGLRHNVDREL
jgi:hypothetical protein